MPYKTIAEIPERIRAMGEKKSRLWMRVWNSVYEQMLDEGRTVEEAERRAFSAANAQVSDSTDNSAVAEEVATVDNEGNGKLEEGIQMGTAYTITSQVIELGEMGDDAQESWIQLAKAGEFHHWSGRKFKLDRSVFEAMADNLDRIGGEAPVNLLHPELRERMGARISAEDFRAVGRIVELRVSDERLDARVVWTEEGRDFVRSGKFRHISPEIAFEYQTDEGSKIGTVLVGAALTNKPFLKGMEPLAASEEPTVGTEPTITTSPVDGEEDIMSETTLACVAEKLGVESGDETALLTALDTAIANMDRAEKAETERDDLLKRVVALEGREAARDAEELYGALLGEGKVVPAQREDVLKMALNDIEATRSFFANAAPVINLEEAGTATTEWKEEITGNDATSVGVNASDELDSRARKLMSAEDGLTYEVACNRVMADDPALTRAFAGF